MIFGQLRSRVTAVGRTAGQKDGRDSKHPSGCANETEHLSSFEPRQVSCHFRAARVILGASCDQAFVGFRHDLSVALFPEPASAQVRRRFHRRFAPDGPGSRAGSFFPEPEVDSSLIRLDVLDAPPVSVKDEALFFKVVRGAFHQKRKTIANSLSQENVLKERWSRLALASIGG
jgi:hypothetical protein